MLAWIRSPRGSVATAIAVAVVAIGLLLVPLVRPRGSALPPTAGTTPAAVASADLPDAPRRAEVPSATASPTAPAETVRDTSGPQPERASASDQPESTIKSAVPAPVAPTFDIVRVDPHGDAVVAGRGVPGAEVALVDDGRVLATVTADATGQFALVPPTLPPGDHYLTLQIKRDGTPGLSSEGVAVSVAADAAKPLVALLAPDQPVRVLSDGAGEPAAARVSGPATVLPVAIQSVETAGSGTFTASGVAKAGSQCRLYLNGAFLADVVAGADGHWSVKVEKGMRAGKYTVRADQLDSAGGRVVNRAEVPFDFPAVSAIGHAKRMLMAKALAHAVPMAPVVPASAAVLAAASPLALPTPAGPAALGAPSRTDAAVAAAIVKEVQSATVTHGDSLWRISRKMLGHGINYTEIYASNITQIRDPRLIYPGQIFVLPHHGTP